jgi:hypothetical protein
MKVVKSVLSMAIVLGLGCSKPDGAEVAQQDSLGRDLSLAPVDTSAALSDVPAELPPAETRPAPAPAPPPAAPKPAPPPVSRPAAAAPSPSPAPAPAPAPPPAPATRSLGAGTTLSLAAVDSFSTRTHKVGQTVTARVSQDVKDDNGRTVIPAGATVMLTITELAVSENKSDPGKLALRATRVTIGGESYEIDGASASVEHTLKGRGVQAGDAAKVGAGAAAGAIVGRVLSGKKKGAVVGGVIGAAAGAAAASQSYDRDVIVAAGAKILITLREALTIGS